jgi:hypothetical protein
MSYEDIEAKLAERTAALEVLRQRQEPISEKVLD